MFKNMKKILTLALPVVALSFTSCNNAAKVVTYAQMRRFASENYDQHAIDTVPTNYEANFNSMRTNFTVTYVTPTGGSDSFTFSTGFGNLHVTFKDHYAIPLASTLIDRIDRYYSDFTSLAITLQKEPPVKLIYELLGGNCSKIDLVASQKIAGNVLIRMLQFIVGGFDVITELTGYMDPKGISGGPKICMLVDQCITQLLNLLGLVDYKPSLYMLMDFIALTISDSSESHGDVFETYVTTNSYGFLNKLDFNFKSNFVISGLAAFKRYEKTTPETGDHPVEIEAPYNFTITGSFDYDFNITSSYVG